MAKTETKTKTTKAKTTKKVRMVRKSPLRMPKRDRLYYRYRNLSDMWFQYANLIEQSGGPNASKLKKDAMFQAAEYQRSAISLEEESLVEDEKEKAKK